MEFLMLCVKLFVFCVVLMSVVGYCVGRWRKDARIWYDALHTDKDDKEPLLFLIAYDYVGHWIILGMCHNLRKEAVEIANRKRRRPKDEQKS